MTPVEFFAALFAILVLSKLAILFIRPTLWLKMSRAFLRCRLATAVYLILAGIVGHYLLASMSIVQLAAVMLFASLLMAASLIPYAETILIEAGDIFATRLDIIRNSWILIIIWATLSIWTLLALFH